MGWTSDALAGGDLSETGTGRSTLREGACVATVLRPVSMNYNVSLPTVDQKCSVRFSRWIFQMFRAELTRSCAVVRDKDMCALLDHHDA